MSQEESENDDRLRMLEEAVADRDRRSFRRLDQELAHVELALVRWGAWVRREGANRPPNAPPDRSLFYRIMREGWGAVPHAAYGAPEQPIPEDVLCVDVAIARLRGRLRDAAWIHWVSGPPQLEAQARRLGISAPNLKARLVVVREVVGYVLKLVADAA